MDDSYVEGEISLKKEDYVVVVIEGEKFIRNKVESGVVWGEDKEILIKILLESF